LPQAQQEKHSQQAAQEQARHEQHEQQARQQQAAQQARIALEMKAAWRMGDRGQLQLLLNQEDPQTLARAMAYYRYFFQARNTALENYRDTLEQLAQVRSGTAAAQAGLAEKEQRLEEQRRNLGVAQDRREQALRELDASRTVLGHDFARLPHGEPVTATQIFVDPVVDDPELALEESEEERALEGVEKDVVGVDYAGAEEELLDEESALWKAKVRMLAKYAKAYARKYGGVDEEEEEETKPAAR